MASSKSIPCKFFAQGICRNGVSCAFLHEKVSSAQSSLKTCGPSSPDVPMPTIDSTAVSYDDEHAEGSQACRFFLRGCCRYGDRCRNLHTPTELRSQLQSSTAYKEVKLVEQNTNSSQVSFDSRSNVPCKFFSRPGGCQNNSCPFIHVQSVKDQQDSQDVELEEDEVSHRYFGLWLVLMMI